MSTFQIETNRLILRELSTDDALDFYNLNLNPKVVQYTGDSSFKSVQHALIFLQQYTPYKDYGYGRWAVIEKSTNTFIGWCGLKYHDEGYVDLGFRFFEEQWGKGFATESSKACIKYAKTTLNLSHLIGRVHPKNIASINVLKKLGFKVYKTGECNGINNSIYYKLPLN